MFFGASLDSFDTKTLRSKISKYKVSGIILLIRSALVKLSWKLMLKSVTFVIVQLKIVFYL